MADYTENYGLKKPSDEDFYNVQDFNDNFDIIDTELKKLDEKQTSHTHSASDIASGTLAVEYGGTGAATAASARENLGIKNTVLWTGSHYMSDTQSISLSQKVSEQPTGIVLIFSAYANGEAFDYYFNSFFVPKEFINTHPGGGMSFMLTGGSFEHVAYKYLYISDDHITGSTANIEAGTNNGITYDNKYFVLRHVIGV